MSVSAEPERADPSGEQDLARREGRAAGLGRAFPRLCFRGAASPGGAPHIPDPERVLGAVGIRAATGGRRRTLVVPMDRYLARTRLRTSAHGRRRLAVRLHVSGGGALRRRVVRRTGRDNAPLTGEGRAQYRCGKRATSILVRPPPHQPPAAIPASRSRRVPRQPPAGRVPCQSWLPSPSPPQPQGRRPRRAGVRGPSPASWRQRSCRPRRPRS